MDTRGDFPSETEEILCALPEKEVDAVPRKITPAEYLSSPELQRARKVASERAQQSAFERKMAFRSAQVSNPIKGQPRRKRGRKRR